MMQRHSVLRTYTLAEFAVEQRLLRREKLLNRLREEKLEALKLKVSKRASKHFGSFVKKNSDTQIKCSNYTFDVFSLYS